MSLVYALKLMCDLYHYYVLIALAGLLSMTSDVLMVLPLLLSAGAGIGYRLAGRGERARYLPLLLGLLVVPFGLKRADIILSIPTVVYSVMYVKGNRRATDYYYAYERFKHGMLAIGALLILSLINSMQSFASAIPSLFLHLALSITLLRILRHENHVIRQKRFQMMNLASVLGMCAVGVALSTEWVLARLRWMLGRLVDWVLMPVLQAAVWVLNWVVKAIGWLIALIPWKEQAIEMGEEALPQMSLENGIIMPETIEEVAANPMLKQILQITGVVLLCVVGFLVMRALSKQARHLPEFEKKEERESIDAPGSLKDVLGNALRRRNDPVLAIRHVYRKFLRMAEGKSVPLNGCQNSLQVRDLSEDAFEPEALDDLRAIYIRARYDADASEADLNRARDALSRLKKK